MHVLNIALCVFVRGGGALNLGKGAAGEGGWGVKVDDVTFVKKNRLCKI